MSQAYGPNIVTEDLIMLVDPANPKCYSGSGTAVKDLVRGQVGTMNGSMTVDADKRFVFDGSNDYINMNKTYIGGDDIAFSDATHYTLEAWIYVHTSQGTTTSADSIVGNRSSYGVGMQVGISNSNPRINFGARSTSNFYGSEFSYNQWYHVVWAKQDNSFTRVFMNGVLDTTSSITSYDVPSGQAYSNMSIGNSSGRVTGFYDGLMGPVAIYKRGLSDAEIIQNFNAHRGRFGV